MTSDNERGREVEPAGGVSEAAGAGRSRPRTRVISEAVVGAIPAEGEAVAAATSEGALGPRTRVVAEAIVAAIPAEGRADDDDGAGA